VSVGMPATVRLDAFPELELHGTVERVSEFPVPTSWMGSTVKEYETFVRIHESPAGLRPGLTAEVRVCVERTPDALQVPVQAIFEHGDKYYCVTGDGSRWSARELTVGSTNDKTVVVRGGLEAGEEVVLNAAPYREKVALPEVRPQPRQAGLAAAGGGKQRPDAPPAEKSGKLDDLATLVNDAFRQYDADGDGKMRLADLPERLRLRLQAADVNHDGLVDRAELAALAGKLAGDAGGRPANATKGVAVDLNSH
jgi:HlyD family secretion protein